MRADPVNATGPKRPKRPALFFDRDGVLNVDHGFVSTPEAFEWVDGAKAAIRLLNDAGWLVIVVTNQSGVARGYYGEAQVRDLHDWMNRDLAKDGAHIDAFYYCPHLPDGTVAEYRRDCDCRKPAPGMLLQAIAAWDVDAARSLLIGDKESDLAAAAAAGIRAKRFTAGDDLLEMVGGIILAGQSREVEGAKR